MPGAVPAGSGAAPWAGLLESLGLTCSIATAAKILGIGRTTAFELLRRGEFPVEVIGLGRVRRVRTADLLAYLRVSPTGQPANTPGEGTTHPATAGDGPHAA
ncbi:MAG TPA: helix-turn-helix domain-containing protein [Kineosporiaceae bacterium]